MAVIGLSIPTAVPDAQPDTAIQFARRAEAAGFGAMWTLDRLAFPNQEPLLGLAAAAALTSRMHLGTAVLLATLRPPALLAKMIATLDQISNGRVILGIGVGSRADDFAAAGVPFADRGSRAEELVEILKLAWSGAPVVHHGRFYDIETGPVGPAPVQRPHPPIWFGGSADRALERVARLADGYIPGSAGGGAGFKAATDKVRQLAEAAGRDPASITFGAQVSICVDDDRARALELAERRFDYYYPGGRGNRTAGAALGSADECLRVIDAYVAAGADHVFLSPVTASLSHLDRICEQVFPRIAA
jgi:probable F420-dependent oxidoreductase